MRDNRLRTSVPSSSDRAWIGYASAAVIAAAYHFPFVRMVWEIGDEGVSLDGARRIIQGQLFARDFMEMVGPGSFWWLALFFKAFGATVVTAHALLWVTGIAITVLAFHLSRRIDGNAILCAAFITLTTIPLWPGNSHHWDATLFSLVAFTALVEWQRSNRKWLLVACGSAAGATTLVIQQKGVLMITAALLCILILKANELKKTVALLLFPYVMVVSTALTFYAVKGALGDLIFANYIWPRSHYLGVNASRYGYSFLSMFSAIIDVQNPAGWITGFFLLLPLAIVFAIPALLLATALIFRGRAFTRELLPFWICGTAVWFTEIHKPDMAHLLWASPILLVLLSRFLRMTHSHRLSACCIAAASVGFATVRLVHPLQAHTRIQSRSGPFWSVKPDNALAFIQAHTRRGDPVFIYPYYVLYNFLSDTQNPTRFDYFLYGYDTPQQFHEAVDALESKRVRYVLWSTPESLARLSLSFPAYHPPPHDQQIIEPYLESHYHQIGVENDFRILERNP